MRNRSHLALMELLIMIAVFALAAALCLQVFVFSDLSSARGVETDEAALRCQSAAELIKSARGDWEKAAEDLGAQPLENGLSLFFDDRWQRCGADSARYSLVARALPEEYPGLGKAEICVSTSGGGELFSLTAAWQEVSGDG